MSLRLPRKSIRSFVLLSSLAAVLLYILLAGHGGNDISGSLQAVAPWSDEEGPLTLPQESPKVSGEEREMSAVLPAALKGNYLIFRTENLPVQVLLGSTELYRTAEPAAHQTIGDEWHMIPLPSGATGQTLTIRSTVLFPNGSNFINAVYVGDRAELIRLLFRQHLLEFTISVLLFLLGAAMLLGSRFLLSRRLAAHMPVSFALLSLVLGIWTATQTAIPELLWGNTGLLLFLTYALLPLASVSVCFFLRTLPAPGWLRTVYLWLGLVQIAFWVLEIAAEAFHVAAYVETLPYARALMALMLVLFLFQLPGLIRNRDEHLYLLMGLSCLGGTIIADLLNVHAGVYDYAHNTRFGILMLTLLIVFQYSLRIRNSIRIADEAGLMRRLAYQDSLTRLGNRLALVRDQETLIAKKSGCVGIVQMDINDLKTVNDRFGHEAGDALIRRAAGAITAAFDDIGTSYRIGGDEFVSLLSDEHCVINAETCLERLKKACDEQNVDQPHPLSIAMGFTVFNAASGERFYDLVRTADMRMYEMKREMKAARREER